MTYRIALSAPLAFFIVLGVQAQDPLGSTEAARQLTEAEANAIQSAAKHDGPADASPSREHPYPRVLIIPGAIKATYAKKPDATLDLLLKIGKTAEPRVSIHALACISALVCSPVQGWLSTHWDSAKWDDRPSGGYVTATPREHCYGVSVRIVNDARTSREQKKNK